MLWKVTLIADGDREMTREEIVELADAVAGWNGVATGIGSPSYGASLVVTADSATEALDTATSRFTAAAARAGLPAWPVSDREVVGELEDDEEAAEGYWDVTYGADEPG